MSDILKAIVQEQEAHREFLKANYTKENIIVAIKPIFDKYELNAILFHGYTPSFNDGDPCTHYGDVFDDSEMFDYVCFETIAELTGLDEEQEEKFNEKLAAIEWADRSTYSRTDEFRDVRNDLSVIDDIVEYIYETNYNVLVYRNEEGEIKIRHEDYYDY